MKFSAEREVILAPLQAVIGVVERRQTMPILANVLVAARGDQISITATDLEVELVAKVSVTHSAGRRGHSPRKEAAGYRAGITRKGACIDHD